MALFKFTIQNIRSLPGSVYEIRFTCPETEWKAFNAGQYLELKIPDLNYCYFSIASAPHQDWLDIHMQVNRESERSIQILDYLQDNKTIDIEMASGDCTLDKLPEENGPLLLIAAGTGFAQVKSITEDLIHQGVDRPIHIYWGAKKVTGLYESELPEAWSDHHKNVHFSAVVSEQSDWKGKQGLLYQAVISDLDTLDLAQAVCCGSPAMVYATLDKLVEQGFREDQMISDVFAFAPRD